MSALALNLSQAATIKTLSKDMGAENALSQNTINEYLELLNRLLRLLSS